MQREILEEAELKKPGYFDNALKAMRIQWGQDAVPRYNKEFATPDNPPELKNLVQNGLTTRRGHVQFEFLGPSQNELKGLADFFTSHPSTAGSNGPMVVKTV